jgi:hypothetical protein
MLERIGIMRDVTIPEARKAGQRGRKEALLCCEKHWRYLRGTGLPDWAAVRQRYHARYCALCWRYSNPDGDARGYDDCRGCPLGCIFLWRKVACAKHDREWRKGTAALHKKIVRVIHKLYPDVKLPRYRKPDRRMRGKDEA